MRTKNSAVMFIACVFCAAMVRNVAAFQFITDASLKGCNQGNYKLKLEKKLSDNEIWAIEEQIKSEDAIKGDVSSKETTRLDVSGQVFKVKVTCVAEPNDDSYSVNALYFGETLRVGDVHTVEKSKLISLRKHPWKCGIKLVIALDGTFEEEDIDSSYCRKNKDLWLSNLAE
ncbi:hypothetical protein ACFL6Y_10940 [Elusimicrobiota bacterium]